MQVDESKIWVIGSKRYNADKEIYWSDRLPNFSDFDVLIMDTQYLTTGVIEDIDYEEFETARNLIFDRFMKGGIIFCMISPYLFGATKFKSTLVNNYLLSPIGIETVTVPPAKRLEYKEAIFPGKYYAKVKEYSLYIKRFDLDFARYQRKGLVDDVRLSPLDGTSALTKGGQLVGGGFKIEEVYKTELQSETISYSQGTIYFLPYLGANAARESMELLISLITKKKDIKEAPPQWESGISVPGADKLSSEISAKQLHINTLNEEIANREKERVKLLRYRNLLWARDDILEDVVKDAFVLLGFSEIKKIREPNLEDSVFSFKHVSEYKYGVIEAKGSDKRTSMADLTQCNKWVEDYLLDNIKVKGLFIPNQRRLDSYPSSKAAREKFEPNEIEYAQKREICIMPCHVLFETVVKALKGNKPDRKSIEEKIAQTNGLLTGFP